jgi:hypothetical protein
MLLFKVDINRSTIGSSGQKMVTLSEKIAEKEGWGIVKSRPIKEQKAHIKPQFLYSSKIIITKNLNNK